MNKTKELLEIEKEWTGKHVRYYIYDARKRVKTFEGPFLGIVRGATNNAAAVEDRLEGQTHRNSISFTGFLIIKPDDGAEEEEAFLSKCEKILEG